MKLDFTEFSYGFALTNECINNSTHKVTSAPLFPSLYAEGKVGGGFDVKIDSAIPLFFQFKLSEYMVRKSAKERRLNLFDSNFYRMPLRPLKHSEQHNLLLDLEGGNKLVYYATPHFHSLQELNEAYLNKQVIEKSVFIKPSEIGKLPDKEKHCVSFKKGKPIYLLSDYKIIREELQIGDNFNELFGKDIRDSEEIDLFGLSINLQNIVRERYFLQRDWLEEALRSIREDEPIFQITFITRFFLGSEVFFFNPK